jgi:hypothetical protein
METTLYTKTGGFPVRQLWQSENQSVYPRLSQEFPWVYSKFSWLNHGKISG